MQKMTAYYNEHDLYAAEWLRNLIKAGHIAPGEVDERSIVDVRPNDLRGFTQCHFFAGVGVWSYALRRAGWPDDREVWTGSCPCQPFSDTGKKGGFDDERHLWPAFDWLIQQCRPGVVFGEQVASKDGLAWLDLVQTDMENKGYAIGAVDFCAAGVGAPHIRQRSWFVAERLDDTAGARHKSKGGREQEKPESRKCLSGVGCESGGLGDTIDPGLEGHPGHEDHQAGRKEQDRPASEASGTGGLEPCAFCGYEFDQETLGRYGCPNCLGEGLDEDGGMENTTTERLQRGLIAERQKQTENSGLLSTGSGDDVSGPGQTNGYWRDADWLGCRDGKWRPVKPGTFPLVDGLTSDMGSVRTGEDSPFRVIKDSETGKSIGQAPWRVGMLKAYGNAINAEVATEVIKAYIGR